jgi:hypothetical protein
VTAPGQTDINPKPVPDTEDEESVVETTSDTERMEFLPFRPHIPTEPCEKDSEHRRHAHFIQEPHNNGSSYMDSLAERLCPGYSEQLEPTRQQPEHRHQAADERPSATETTRKAIAAYKELSPTMRDAVRGAAARPRRGHFSSAGPAT